MQLMKGINLGGYLSQCKHGIQHYEAFIMRDDIRKIAKWGFDHVRLPIDYEVLETEDGKVKESGYRYVMQVADWCKAEGLNVIIDLHKAYGYDFNDAGNESKNTLFGDETLKKRFVDLWIQIVKRFKNCANVAFELLNEVVEKENAEAWNALIKMTVEAIRKDAPSAPIIYGGIQWNSVKTLKLLEKPMDSNIIFTFHFYEPLLFTHQKAYWVKGMDRKADIAYPQTKEYYVEGSKPLGYQGEVVGKTKSAVMGKPFIRELILEAVEAAKKAGVSLYCGEYGVIDQAPAEDSLRWFQDVKAVFKEYNIGSAIWTYKEKDFGLAGNHYDSVRDQIIQC